MSFEKANTKPSYSNEGSKKIEKQPNKSRGIPLNAPEKTEIEAYYDRLKESSMNADELMDRFLRLTDFSKPGHPIIMDERLKGDVQQFIQDMAKAIDPQFNWNFWVELCKEHRKRKNKTSS